MPQKGDDTIHILEGKATLFKREGSPLWHVRFKAYGKWERVTTKSEDVELQRKVSHYLQPILSHQFLNNLA